MAGKDKFCNTDFVAYPETRGTDSPTQMNQNQRNAPDVGKIDITGYLKDLDVGSTTPTGGGTDDFQKKKTFVLEERARALAEHLKFYEATSLLEEISVIDGDAELGIKLLMAECYMQLGRENKAMRAIKDIKKIIFAPPGVSVEDVIGLGEGFRSSSAFVRAMVLFRIASEMITKSESMSPNDKVDGIARCISLARKAIDAATETKSKKSSDSGSGEGIQGLLKSFLDPEILAMVGDDGEIDASKLLKKATESSGGKNVKSGRMRVIILDFGIEYMEEMLEELRSIEGAHPERQTLKDAWSATHIGYHLANLEEFGKSYRVRKTGVDAMDRRFGANAGAYRVYSVLLHNMGVVLHNSQKYAEAEQIYVKALDAKEMVLDYDDDGEKQKDIELTRNALKNTRRHMKS